MERKKPLTAAIGIVMIVALLLLAGLRTPALAVAAGTGKPQVFAGTVVTASGSPVGEVAVKLYAMPETNGAATLIGTAFTASSGRWSFAAPAYAVLPKAAQRAAAADMGYLNVEAVALSGPSLATAVESAWVGTATNSVESGGTRPLPMRMRLSTSATAFSAGCCSPRFGCGPPEMQKVLGHAHSYTVVGEYHAYWNASGGLTYTRGATSSIGSYLATSGGGFSFNGYDSFSTSQSLTMGFPSNGPYDSHQMVISLDYVKRHFVVRDIVSGNICFSWNQIDEDGLYDPGNGWFVFKEGANVIKYDGKARYQWEKAHHPGHINGVGAGGFFALSQGNALTYGVSAQAFGVGIQATTSHSNDVAQTYQAGSSRSRYHWVWGNNASLTHNPEVEYSY